MPTVLVECGFITHSSEGRYLNSVYGQEIIASAIFRATRDFLKYKHPEISFEPEEGETPIEVSDVAEETNLEGSPNEEEITEMKQSYYSVQIMASVDSVSTNSSEFSSLNLPVERKFIESGSIYRYKYYVGRFTSKREAKTVQKEVQSLGFTDAFLLIFDS